MISELQIKSFKSIFDMKLELKPLNVLSGLNGSGKSSVIQAIRMLLNSENHSSPYIGGIGDYSELRSKSSQPSSPIEISALSEDSSSKITLSESLNQHSDQKLNVNYDYIGADRLGPSSTLPTIPSGEKHITIGKQGEFCVDYFLNFEDILISSELLHPNTKSMKLSHQLTEWMNEISPGLKFDFSREAKHDVSHIEINGFRSANTGFGISYVLPIVLAMLVMSSKDPGASILKSTAKAWFEKNMITPPLLLLENPEAHLHPKGQTALGRLAGKAAACGMQIIVETHSDHFLDGIRIEAKLKSISPDNVGIYFFEKNNENISESTSVKLDEHGKLDHWPPGFFDQSFFNLKELSKR